MLRTRNSCNTDADDLTVHIGGLVQVAGGPHVGPMNLAFRGSIPSALAMVTASNGVFISASIHALRVQRWMYRGMYFLA